MPTRQQMADAKHYRQTETAKCVKCLVVYPWSNFNRSPSRRPFGLASVCKDCDRERKSGQKRTKWYAQPEIEREKSRCRELRKKFGITAAEYETVFESQNGLCAICQKPETYIHHATQKPARLAVDHCHTTGKVRQLLCTRCNKGLGCFKDEPALLRQAALYLEKHHAV